MLLRFWYWRVFLAVQMLGLILTFVSPAISGKSDVLEFSGLGLLLPGTFVAAVTFWDWRTGTATTIVLGSAIALMTNFVLCLMPWLVYRAIRVMKG